MPKPKEQKIGLFKIESGSEKMVRWGNGATMFLSMNVKFKDRVSHVRVQDGTGKSYDMPAALVMQAAEALKKIDPAKRFVCGFHGSFETTTSKQHPECPSCFSAALENSVRLSNQSGVVEEEDP